jgi:hypothetical protein
MGRSFQTGRFPSGEAPSVLEMQYANGQTFLKGALVKLNADGTISECGADPALITGVALEAAGSRPGFNAANNPALVQGGMQVVSVAIADRTTIFSCRGVNGGTDPVTPALTNIGEDYGCAKTGAGDWVLDLAEVTTKQWRIVDVDVDNKVFFVKIIQTFMDLQ